MFPVGLKFPFHFPMIPRRSIEPEVGPKYLYLIPYASFMGA